MKISKKWLEEFIPGLNLAPEAIKECLIAGGLEVEECLTTAGDTIYTLKITPNRGDCLSIQGVARDLAALVGHKWTAGAYPQAAVTSTAQVGIRLNTPECTFYSNKVLTKLNNQITLPSFITERLENAGWQVINPIVAITNYVMLELGQPLHAYALKDVGTKVAVRAAYVEEEFTDLAQRQITLAPSDIVVANAQDKAIALAGVIGAYNSAVDATTTDIMLESAYFSVETVAFTARRHNYKTEASFRFERGVDSKQVTVALEYAAYLINKYCAGEVATSNTQGAIPKERSITVTADYINHRLGTKFTALELSSMLQKLHLPVDIKAEELQVTIPSFRNDLTIAADLTEEIARSYGLDSIVPLPLISSGQSNTASLLDNIKQFKNYLISRGYNEAITYSFIAQDLNSCFSSNATLTVSNPIADTMNTMRSSLLPGLLQALSYNLNRQVEDIKLFEVGSIYLPDRELLYAGMAITGRALPYGWANNKAQVDFYDLKQDLMAYTNNLGLELTFKKEAITGLHPGQSAAIYHQGNLIGKIGLLHPNLSKQFAIKGNVVLLEFECSILINEVTKYFTPISKFPSINRDLAMVVAEDVPVEAIQEVIYALGGKLLQKVTLFDLFRAPSLGVGKKSLAFNLLLQHKERTLLEQEVEELQNTIVTNLQQKFNATLRE